MKSRKIFVLNPSQSKRLIAKGILGLIQVQEALESGKILVGRGTTNAYVLEELLKQTGQKTNYKKADYVAGQIVAGKSFMSWWVNKGVRAPEIVFDHGKMVEVADRVKNFLKFKAGDLVIKGGNALDMKGIPGVLVGNQRDGGTIGSIQSLIQAKGLELICPIGLEKLVFTDLTEISPLLGTENMDHPSEGMKCGLIPMPYATVMTEVEALEVLFDCETFHVASGGVGGAEGSVSLLVDGYDEDEMKKITTFMEKIAQEPVFIPNI